MKMKAMKHMQTSSNNIPSTWEIWWAFVEFEGQPGNGKTRPVLVIPSNNNDAPLVMSLKMTTHPPRLNYPGEYEIIDYQKAGLKKKTVIRCSKAILLDQKAFSSKIGILQPVDIMNVSNILRQLG